MSQNATGSKWSKSHELKLITRLGDLLSKNGQAFLSKNSNFHKFDVGLTGRRTWLQPDVFNTCRSRCANVKPITRLQAQMSHLAGC